MGIFRKKKKKKEKKPITIDRVLKFLSPIFIIVLIVVAFSSTVKSCGIVDKYDSLKTELSQNFDVSDKLTNNKIIAADEYNLKQKLGPLGADLPVFINGEFLKEVFTNTNAFSVRDDIELTSSEVGAFANMLNTETPIGIKIKILEFNIEVLEAGCFEFSSISQVDLKNVDLGVDIDTTDITNLYLVSSSIVVIKNSILEVFNSTCQINNLSSENNDFVLGLLNTLIGYKDDFSMEILIKTINDYSIKTATSIIVDNNKIYYKI